MVIVRVQSTSDVLSAIRRLDGLFVATAVEGLEAKARLSAGVPETEIYMMSDEG